MKTIFLVAISILAVLPTTQAHYCGSCSKAFCHPVPKHCKGGLTYDICGCCFDRCAKVKGEKCGGMFNLHGNCDRGLTCDKERKSVLFRSHSIGICVAISKWFLV